MTPTHLDLAQLPSLPEVVAAPLFTSATGAELELVTRDGQRHRLKLTGDERAARELAAALWQALDRTH